MFKKTGFLKSPQSKPKEKYLLLFIVAFIGMMIAFIPSMIQNGGRFIYYGDFNSQQLMFYQHAHDVVTEKGIGWDWGTDLGSSFISSYAFYLLGSPFFWLTTIFPSGAVTYLLPWLLALKTAVAAVSAYAYIRFFVKDTNACFIGGMLYAFSGFQTYNVFFNHFHDATAFFPLMLLGFELLVQKNKKGAFAISVAICASISYFFLACDAVFLVIYFFIRCTDKDFDINIKKFALLIFEAVLGVLIACAIFVPACVDVITNPRVSERLYGMQMVFYDDNVRIPRIIQAFFMLSDMPARVNILKSDTVRWSSIAGYLPLFSMAGVIAFMRTRKKHWASKAIIVFGIMACIPVLNSAFTLFNASYYARWYYMPILIMCMMTAKVLSEKKEDLWKGFVPVAVVAGFFIAVGMLPTQENDKTVYGKLPNYIELYYVQAIVTILMLVLLFVLIKYVPKLKEKYPQFTYMRVASVMTAAACIICMASSVIYGTYQDENHATYLKYGVNGKDNLDIEKLESNSENYNPDNNFFRIDTSENVDNWCMFWGLSSMRCFHSVVSPSIMDFYISLGQTRDVASRMEPKLYPLRSLLSAKYYFKQLSQNQLEGTMSNAKPNQIVDLKGFKYVDTQNSFNIYENEYYIPMGFTYDYFCLDNNIQSQTDDTKKTQMLMKALVLNNEQAAKYGQYITYHNFTADELTEAEYYKNCQEKQQNCCDSFNYSSDGFDATITLDSPKLVFFSVPYDEGWTAEVNGQAVDVEKVDYGFMAVLCQTGDNTIKFTYTQKGLTYGIIGTCTGVVIFAGYIVYWKFRKKNDILPENDDNNDNDNDNDNDESEAESSDSVDNSAADTANLPEAETNEDTENVSDLVTESTDSQEENL